MYDRALSVNVRTTGQALLAYCYENQWAGHDPYDALNSKLFASLPLFRSPLSRLVLTQILRRSPFNVRGFLRVPKTRNPKAIALFLSALIKAPELGGGRTNEFLALLVEELIALRSPKSSYWCWGYSFPWQTRTIIVPRDAPNLVCTSFVAGALLDLYEQSRESRYLSMAVSAGEYILNELYWDDGNSIAGFGYPLSSMRSRVHNANFLGAALFARIYRLSGELKFLDPALKVARYSARQQQSDGSWTYGEASTQQWIDNFHTGYNLCALQQIDRELDTDEFESQTQRGFEFYKAHFFHENGAAKYFHNRAYPVDIHCVAQSIITLLAFKDLDPDNISLACSVFLWAKNHMWDDRGFFYYRVLRFCTIRTSYMRWSQAWMLLAISALLAESEVAQPHLLRATVEA